MKNEEKIDFLVQNCFVAIEDRTADYTSKVFLNYNLYDDNEKNKIHFVKKNIKQLKKELGKLEGDLAESINSIYSLKINFPDYKHFYDMAHKCLEKPLKEYIEWTIYFESEGNNTHYKEKFVEGKSAIEYKALKKWIKAVSNCLNLNLLEEHEPNFSFGTESTINQEFYPNKKTSELIRFRNGRRLNLKERYILLDKFIGINKAIKKLNIKNEEKEKFLAFLLNCNPKNAQQILNGTYDSKVREIEIIEYLKTIKKE